MWIKLEKSYFKIIKKNKHRYIVATYIPPENSPVYNVYDVDLFRKLEIELDLDSQKRDVYLAGDLNSRTGGKNYSR